MRILSALLLFLPTTVAAQGTITGVVFRDNDWAPISEAIVTIPLRDKSVTTDADGRFRLENIKAGFVDVTVRRVGYQPYTEKVTIRDGKTLALEIQMLRMVILNAVEVEDARIKSFEEHRALGVGQFLSRADLATREQMKLGNVIAQLTGARVRFDVGGTAFLAGRGTNRTNKNATCYSQVYLDNAMVYRNQAIPGGRLPEEPFNINSIAVDQIEAVEYYASAGQAPHRYNLIGAECGVLVLHTRRQTTAKR